MRGGLPGEDPDRVAGDRALKGEDGEAAAGAGKALVDVQLDHRVTRPDRSDRAGVARAGHESRPERGAGTAAVDRRQDQSAQNTFREENRSGHRGEPPAQPKGCRTPMRFAYYPGCSAKSSCAELNEAMRNVAPKLDLQLSETESATCTGAREIRAIDPIGFLALNVRILALAERGALPLMTICNTCTLNLIDANARFLEDEHIAREINERLTPEGLKYRGTTRVTHFLWVLFEDIGME